MPLRIKDERRQSGHFLHKLIDVLVIGLTTVIAGWNEFNGMEDFGKAKESFFRTFLELPHGIPDEKTFARVFSWIEPGALLSGLQTWLMGVNKADGRTINIDGETIRGSACQGRQESREVLTEEDISRLNGKEKWKDIRTIILYRRRSEEKGKPTVDSRYSSIIGRWKI
jgi:hypothetical protein